MPAAPVARHTGLLGHVPPWAKTVAVGTLFAGLLAALAAAYTRRKLAAWRARLNAHLLAKAAAKKRREAKTQNPNAGFISSPLVVGRLTKRSPKLFHHYHYDKIVGNNIGKAPQGKYLSFTVTWGMGGMFETTSIDLVYANGEAGIFYSPRAINSPSELYVRYATDDVYGVTPQAGITITTGNVWGTRFEQEGVIAYQGPFTYFGGSGGILTGELFVANDAVSGQWTSEVTGEGAGLALGAPPLEGHVYVTNSHMLVRVPISRWAQKLQNAWRSLFHHP